MTDSNRENWEHCAPCWDGFTLPSDWRTIWADEWRPYFDEPEAS